MIKGADCPGRITAMLLDLDHFNVNRAKKGCAELIEAYPSHLKCPYLFEDHRPFYNTFLLGSFTQAPFP